jgi:hypothetical protein
MMIQPINVDEKWPLLHKGRARYWARRPAAHSLTALVVIRLSSQPFAGGIASLP